MGAWLVVTLLVFSLMGGIFHEYYTVALAPAVAALVGMGVGEAWQRRAPVTGPVVLASVSAVTSVWAFVLLSRTTAYEEWLRLGVLALGLVAAALLLVVGQVHRRVVPAVVAVAVVAGLGGPVAYSATTLATAHTGSIVTAGPSTVGAPGGGPGGPPGGAVAGGAPGQAPGQPCPEPAPPGAAAARRWGASSTPPRRTAAVVQALAADADRVHVGGRRRRVERAAGLQLGTGLPVMAVGGFNGSDPYPTLVQFQQYVADGRIHYFLAGGGFPGQQGGSGVADEINSWVSAAYAPVTIGGTTFYDLTQPLGATDQ